MFKKFVPYAHAKSVYEVDPSFFKKAGVKTLFIDLDNTLDSYKSYHPKQKSFDFIKSIIDEGITPVVISNNRGKRVSSFANDLKIDYVAKARKPFAGKINQEILKRGLQKNDVMLVGDQLITDVLAGRHAHIRVLLTEKIVKEDQWTTHINRLMDRPIRHFLKRKGALKDWRNM
ncbi:MAG: YqeG family HAD IIIA-type phosphatase [Bacilli bacterium]|nr:YqeG family HAD IIIA-type phosphatase [Bacilli bacterium]